MSIMHKKTGQGGERSNQKLAVKCAPTKKKNQVDTIPLKNKKRRKERMIQRNIGFGQDLRGTTEMEGRSIYIESREGRDRSLSWMTAAMKRKGTQLIDHGRRKEGRSSTATTSPHLLPWPMELRRGERPSSKISTQVEKDTLKKRGSSAESETGQMSDEGSKLRLLERRERIGGKNRIKAPAWFKGGDGSSSLQS